MQCPRCQGSGKCTECNGSGFTECTACDGKGRKATSRGIAYDCKPCHGTGRVECPVVCSSCAGSGVITEQLQQETRDKYRMKFANFTPSGTLTLPLLAILFGVHVLVTLKPEILGHFILRRTSFSAGEFWTILTPELVHTSHLHLLLNLLFLYYWGQIAEGLSGKARYAALYLTTAVSATLVSFLGNVIVGGDEYAGIGASGFGFGIVGYLLALHRRWKIGPPGELQRVGYLALALLVGGFAAQYSGIHLLDNWGHLGGILSGFLFGVLLPRPKGH